MQVVDALSLLVRAMILAAVVGSIAIFFNVRSELDETRVETPRIEHSGHFSPDYETVDPYAVPDSDYDPPENDWGG